MKEDELTGRGEPAAENVGELREALEAIPPELEDELEKSGIDIHNPEVSRTIEILLSRSYSGPLLLPPAFMLEEYKKEFPEIIPRLIGWTDRQISHRHNLEAASATASERRKDRSQIGSLIVACLGLTGAIITGFVGQTAIACVLAVVGVGGPVTALALASKLNFGNNSSPNGKVK